MNISWDIKSDPLEDVKRAVKLIREQGPRQISFREALDHDMQMLYLAGYNDEQVNDYVKSVIESHNQCIQRTPEKRRP